MVRTSTCAPNDRPAAHRRGKAKPRVTTSSAETRQSTNTRNLEVTTVHRPRLSSKSRDAFRAAPIDAGCHLPKARKVRGAETAESKARVGGRPAVGSRWRREPTVIVSIRILRLRFGRSSFRRNAEMFRNDLQHDLIGASDNRSKSAIPKAPGNGCLSH